MEAQNYFIFSCRAIPMVRVSFMVAQEQVNLADLLGYGLVTNEGWIRS
jgi:hypothetical protein